MFSDKQQPGLSQQTFSKRETRRYFSRRRKINLRREACRWKEADTATARLWVTQRDIRPAKWPPKTNLLGPFDVNSPRISLGRSDFALVNHFNSGFISHKLAASFLVGQLSAPRGHVRGGPGVWSLRVVTGGASLAVVGMTLLVSARAPLQGSGAVRSAGSRRQPQTGHVRCVF